ERERHQERIGVLDLERQLDEGDQRTVEPGHEAEDEKQQADDQHRPELLLPGRRGRQCGAHGRGSPRVPCRCGRLAVLTGMSPYSAKSATLSIDAGDGTSLWRMVERIRRRSDRVVAAVQQVVRAARRPRIWLAQSLQAHT